MQSRHHHLFKPGSSLPKWKRCICTVGKGAFSTEVEEHHSTAGDASRAWELEFLGTGSSRATRTRNTSAVVLRVPGRAFLFDCGEGTTRQFSWAKHRLGALDAVFVTHLHGDHFYGLPGLAMALSDIRSATDPLPVYGPRGLAAIMGPMLRGRPVQLHELSLPRSLEHEHDPSRNVSKRDDDDLGSDSRRSNDGPRKYDGGSIVWEDGQYVIRAARIEHSVWCAGFVVEAKPRPPRIPLDRERIERDYGLAPGPLYKVLAGGTSVTLPNGRRIEPEAVRNVHATPEAPPRKAVILGDTSDPGGIAALALDADVVVHEATCSGGDRTTALLKKHSTAGMAGQFARTIRAKQLVLTHFSPRMDGSLATSETDFVRLLQREAQQTAGSGCQVHAASDFWTLQF
jgi:ribonuclease Z